MKLTQEQVIEKIKNGESLEDFPEWQDNKEVVLEAVKTQGWYLEFASNRFKKDKEVVLEAVKKGYWDSKFVSQEIRDKMKNNNPIRVLEELVKIEKHQEFLELQLDKKNKTNKIKI